MQSLLPKLGLLILRSTAPRHGPVTVARPETSGEAGPFESRANGRNSAGITAVVGLAGEARPRRIPKHSIRFSWCPLVKLGLLGLEQRAHPVPLMQQSQCLLGKLGLQASPSRVPRRNLNSQRVLVESKCP